MKEIVLTLTEKNIIDSLLYSASKSDPIKKSRKTTRILFGVIMLLLTLLFLFSNKLIAGVTFIVGSIAFILFPQYLKIYYKKFFTKLSRSDEQKKLIGLEYKMTFQDHYLETKNNFVESKCLYTNFEYIAETQENIFIKLKTETFLTFPTDQIDNELKNYLKDLCSRYQIEYIEEDWVWK